MKADRQFVTALARGLEVLRCFSQERPELGTTDIAELTGLPQPTVWRLCYTLSKLGYLVQGRQSDRLRAGPGVLALGQASIARAGLAEYAFPLMREIAERFSASVSLAARDRLNMVIVQRAEAPTILRLNLRIGSALPIATSALGWAYLAGVGAERRRAALAAIRRASPDRWDILRRDIDAAIRHHAAHGFILNLQKYHPQINAIGVPVVTGDGREAMALNCGGASAIVSERRLRGPIASALQDLARRLQPALSTRIA
jgi:DNA-binding IclR family transcriptional regulator